MDYISTQDQTALNQRYRTTVILVMAFGISVMVYMLIAKFIPPRQSPPGSETWAQPIYSGAIVLGLAVVVLRRILLSRMFLRQAIERGVSAVLSNLQTLTIICCALAEMAGIGGLIFYLLTGDYQYSWRLGVVSLFLIVYSFPRRGEWERAVAESAKTKSGQPQAAKSKPLPQR
jgi:Na+/proline symporter